LIRGDYGGIHEIVKDERKKREQNKKKLLADESFTLSGVRTVFPSERSRSAGDLENLGYL
jgi:hypothetical protein